ncbi:MAG: VWA domain-containing protein [Thermoproteota archaeon]|nr:VWA domain-containing protein [Thermoproteota archaeon]
MHDLSDTKKEYNSSPEIRYFLAGESEKRSSSKSSQGEGSIKKKETLDALLRKIGREVLRERTPDLQELAQIIDSWLPTEDLSNKENTQSSQSQMPDNSLVSEENETSNGESIISKLIERGYLRNSYKWLTHRGFSSIGQKILVDIMNPLTSGDIGLHETLVQGEGSLLQDSSRRFEIGNDLKMMNAPKSLLNALQRSTKQYGRVRFPLQLNIEDIEEFETSQDVKVSLVYCIDLSSTMRYSSMFGDLSRIEAAKKALWGLFVFNKKYFPSDSISVIGFGALATQVYPIDIPYLKTFEPGGDFMHYTNYQAAFRLASKILTREGYSNKRIVLITDGHPSACFIDQQKDKEDLLSQKPYSHFYSPDLDTLRKLTEIQNLHLDFHPGKLVYLCYRYKQVDGYIAQRTIAEARKCIRRGIQIDTIMISEDDSLLDFVNQMEKVVKGKSYYINPSNIDKALLTDYIRNRREIMT